MLVFWASLRTWVWICMMSLTPLIELHIYHTFLIGLHMKWGGGIICASFFLPAFFLAFLSYFRIFFRIQVLIGRIPPGSCRKNAITWCPASLHITWLGPVLIHMRWLLLPPFLFHRVKGTKMLNLVKVLGFLRLQLTPLTNLLNFTKFGGNNIHFLCCSYVNQITDSPPRKCTYQNLIFVREKLIAFFSHECRTSIFCNCISVQYWVERFRSRCFWISVEQFNVHRAS